jgi:tRNA G18 (ribose-2'-O)-methylase SpoU
MNREDIIEGAILNHWNVRDDLKMESLETLRKIQDESVLPFAVCAINVTGDLNLGIMMRTACLMGAERFIIFGKHGYDRRTTVGAHNYMDIVKAGSINRGGSLEVEYKEFEPTLVKYGYHPIFLETGGVDLNEYDFVNKYTKPCLIFGNEGLGIPAWLMVNHPVVSVPQVGVLRSYNVSAAASIAMYECAMQVKDNVSII